MSVNYGLGDKCWVQTNKKHYGIVVGFDRRGEPVFVHNTKRGGVVKTAVEGFAGYRRRPIQVEQRAPAGKGHVVAQRALSYVGQRYNLLSFNCEHMANLAQTGKAESKQLQEGVFWASVIGLVAAAVANENGTHVDRNGYRRNSRGQFANRRWI